MSKLSFLKAIFKYKRYVNILYIDLNNTFSKNDNLTGILKTFCFNGNIIDWIILDNIWTRVSFSYE